MLRGLALDLLRAIACSSCTPCIFLQTSVYATWLGNIVQYWRFFNAEEYQLFTLDSFGSRHQSLEDLLNGRSHLNHIGWNSLTKSWILSYLTCRQLLIWKDSFHRSKTQNKYMSIKNVPTNIRQTLCCTTSPIFSAPIFPPSNSLLAPNFPPSTGQM